MANPMMANCYNRETARRAIFLMGFADDLPKDDKDKRAATIPPRLRGGWLPQATGWGKSRNDGDCLEGMKTITDCHFTYEMLSRLDL